jgi:hypothetical protein
VISYDPNVIQEFADKLYSRADAIVVGWTAVGALGGFVVGSMMGGGGMRLFLLFLGGAIGYAAGMQRAFLLKLQAQQALCQVQIERNTRADAEASIAT